jgi:thiopeptide-type bacteriocin biosynthesis protein
VVDEDYRRKVARRFRDYRHLLGSLLTEVEDGSRMDSANVPGQALNALASYSAGVRLLRDQLEEVRTQGKLTRTIPDLASSLVHMHLNRMFRSRHREQEAVLCELLNRTYAAGIGRNRNES